MVIEKEVNICDQCKLTKAVINCEICSNDLCKGCSNILEIKFILPLEESSELVTSAPFGILVDTLAARRKRESLKVNNKELFNLNSTICKSCQDYLRKKNYWNELLDTFKNNIITQLKKERLADSL